MEAPAPEPEEPVYVRELLPGVTAKGLGLCVQRVPSSEMACAGTQRGIAPETMIITGGLRKS